MKLSKSMRVMGIIALFLLTSLCLFGEATIKFKETTVNFGDREAGDIVDLKFEFENTGDSVLNIENISTSCGCTTTALDKKEYKPGEKGIIPVKFHTQGYTGNVVKTITVKTNDESNIFSRLEITGNLKITKFAEAGLSSDKLNFETVKLGKQYSQKTVIRNSGTIDLKVIEVIHAPEIYPVFEKSIIPAGKSAEVEIFFDPQVSGNYTTFLKIRTDAYKQRLLVVRLDAVIE